MTNVDIPNWLNRLNKKAGRETCIDNDVLSVPLCVRDVDGIYVKLLCRLR